MPNSRSTPQPTIAHVAQRAGVSIATVSRVINQTAPVDAATSARVQAAMHELHYRPRASARSLATRRTDTLGLLLNRLNSDYFPPFLTGIEQAAREAGYNLLIATTGGQRGCDELPTSIGPHNTDGLLVFVETLSETAIASYYESGFPLVLLYQAPPHKTAIPCVTVENQSAARHLVSHFIQAHGRRRIVFLRGPEINEDSQRRQSGYREALEQHGVEFDPQLVITGEYDRHIAYGSIRRLLSSGIQFDGVFAANDEAAVGALAALREAGRQVPEEVSVAGFDDQQLSAFLTPPLTTVRAPTENVAHEAVRQLVRLVRGQRAQMMTVLPTELVLRRSCGCE